jgi:DNA-binding CsgD family transcriptional regulator
VTQTNTEIPLLAEALADFLDALVASVFLVDETGRIAHTNKSGHAMLRERSILCTAAGKLVVNQTNSARITKEILAAAGGGHMAKGARQVAVPISTRDGEHYIVHVLPLNTRASQRTGAFYPPVAALLVHKAVLDISCVPETIAGLYSLTPSELRVLLAVVETGGVQKARELGVAEATVKTHLHRLFSKTGATRQADLVKLVARFSSPFMARPRPAASLTSPLPADHSTANEGSRDDPVAQPNFSFNTFTGSGFARRWLHPHNRHSTDDAAESVPRLA